MCYVLGNFNVFPEVRFHLNIFPMPSGKQPNKQLIEFYERNEWYLFLNLFDLIEHIRHVLEQHTSIFSIE